MPLPLTHQQSLHARGRDALPERGVLVEPPPLAGLLVLLLAAGEGHPGVQQGQVAPLLLGAVHHCGEKEKEKEKETEKDGTQTTGEM